MRLTAAVLLGVLALAPGGGRAQERKVPPVLDFTMKAIDGKDVHLGKYQGKVVLFVNVASQCGLTPQYEALQVLHSKYADQGLAIVGVPANEFGGQEPGSNAEIARFCQDNYRVKFDLLAKVVVKGEGIAPLYRYLTAKDSNPKFGGEIQWNFPKFLEVASQGTEEGAA
jgi:glutathione peroxidase